MQFISGKVLNNINNELKDFQGSLQFSIKVFLSNYENIIRKVNYVHALITYIQNFSSRDFQHLKYSFQG